MEAGTELAVRRGLDLTRAPDEQWNDEMLAMVSKQLFRGREMTKSSLYYCLSVAEGVGLNPLIGEIYFIPSKSRDAKGPTLTPYIGRNGLVAKAEEQDAYYESDTVHENDEFRITRQQNGVVRVRHSYGAKDRGEIIGAYAFLHFRNGDRPSFFYAKLAEYLPEFDADWKMNASPWGNQRSAMIEKCFDADTEVLTDRGFEPFATAEGRVLQVTERGLEATDARPFWQPYDGPMVAHHSREVDFVVTPNHDLLLTTGKMEAEAVYEAARSRPKVAVVRAFSGATVDMPVSDEDLKLAGYYVADGTQDTRGSFTLNVARAYKIEALRRLGGTERPGRPAGASAGTMTATLDHSVFRFPAERLPNFLLEGKRIDVGRLLALSPRQVRVFVDAWLRFDGDERGRLYCSRLDLVGAFETAAVQAGYSVSVRRSRLNEALSPRPNYVLRVSERQASGLRRWGRNQARRPGLEIEHSDGRGVWCVSVPSGVIVVRRRGYSMLSGNCAMIGAGRKRLRLGNVLVDGEIARVQQQQQMGPGDSEVAQGRSEFDWESVDVSVRERLRAAVERVNELVPLTWTAAKLDMVLSGKPAEELAELAGRIEGEAIVLAEQAAGAAAGRSEGPVGDGVGEGEFSAEGVTDAQVVEELGPEVAERLEGLRGRLQRLEDDLQEPGLSEFDAQQLAEEYHKVFGEIKALEDPGQGSL